MLILAVRSSMINSSLALLRVSVKRLAFSMLTSLIPASSARRVSIAAVWLVLDMIKPYGHFWFSSTAFFIYFQIIFVR